VYFAQAAIASRAPTLLDAYAPLKVPTLPMTYGVPVGVAADCPPAADDVALDAPVLPGELVLHAAASKMIATAPTGAANLRRRPICPRTRCPYMLDLPLH
jgi:hypothetical protein